MDGRKVFRWSARVLAVAMACAAVGVSTGCRVTDPAGNQWTVEPAQRQAPNNGVKIGEFCDDYGTCYDLIDTDGDGVPDFAVNPGDTRWYPIKPSNPGYQPPRRPATRLTTARLDGIYKRSESLGGKTAAYGGEAGVIRPDLDKFGTSPGTTEPEQEWWREGLAERIQFHSGWSTEGFNFGELSAQEWIDATGLDVDAGVATVTEAMRLGVFDTDTLYTEVTIFWTGEFAMPDVLDHQLDYQISTLPSEQAGGDDFYAFELRGDIAQVINFALSMQDKEAGQSTFEFDNLGIHWAIVGDRATKSASLYADGIFVRSIDLP